MQVLKQNDCFIGGTEKQYKEVINASYKTSSDGLIDKKTMISNCIARNGVFWSERANRLVSGELTSGNQLTFNDFLERLKNTVNN